MLDWVVNVAVLTLCFIVIFYLMKKRDENAQKKEREKALAAAAKDNEKVVEKPYSLKELREYDGSDENKPILLAVNYKVFDVTKGKDFYGKSKAFSSLFSPNMVKRIFFSGGSYEVLAGRDASRALATMDLSETALSDEWDDLSNLEADEWGTLKDWEAQFMLKYTYVGWLEKEPVESPAEDGSADQPPVKEVESIGPDQSVDRLENSHQNGDQADDENQQTEPPVEDSEEQNHDQTETNQNENQDHGNDQVEADQDGKCDQEQHQDQIGESTEVKEVEKQGENQEEDKNEAETSQGDQEQNENSD